MALHDGRSTNRNYPLPNADNNMQDDALRLAEALIGVDADVHGLLLALAGKSNTGHGHNMAGISGLVDALSGKAASNHTHALASLNDVTTIGVANGQFLKYVGNSWQPATVSQSDILGLANALNGKSSVEHGHSMSEVAGLVEALLSKASADALSALITSVAGKLTKASDTGLGGFTSAGHNLGNLAGSITPDPLDGNFQYGSKNGATNLNAPPDGYYNLQIDMLNTATPGGLTIVGASKVNGQFKTTAGLKQLVLFRVSGATKVAYIEEATI